MGWIRVGVRCVPTEPGRDIATAWLDEAGCSMFEHEGDALVAYGQDHEVRPSSLEGVRQRLAPLGLAEWTVSVVEEENWNAQWESNYPAVDIGKSISIRAPFHEASEPGKFDHELVIQPRMAFGTGHHETTHGLLHDMVAMPWEGLSVLDMGCGSGVLGIYAAMRGASEVVFVDIDPWSVRNTEENLELNGMKDRGLEVREGGAHVLTESDHGRFDVVIANINRNILLQDFGAYSAALKDRGFVMLSGFMGPDVDALVHKGEGHGFVKKRLHVEGEWCILTLQR